MSGLDRAAFEGELLALHRAGDHESVAHRLVEGYGPEVVGFLSVMLGRPDVAEDVFQSVCLDVLRALPDFRADASFRTWLYAIARNRALKTRSRARDDVPLSRSPAAERLIARARTSTAPFLRTEVKDRVRALRAQLSEEERALLVLRIDRGMDWREIAAVLEPVESDPPRAAARVRKRYQRAKDRLRRLAEASGLLGASDEAE